MEGLDPNLLSQLSALASKAGGEGGEGDEGGIQDMLDGMMQQLMSKDVLYDPLKDLRDKVRNPPFFFSRSFVRTPEPTLKTPPSRIPPLKKKKKKSTRPTFPRTRRQSHRLTSSDTPANIK